MAQCAKLELQSEVRASADKVYDIFKRKLYLMPTICPEVVKDVKLVKGDWETPGSVRLWKYVAGTPESVSETVEAVDDQNKSVTFDALDGDFVKCYKTFKASVSVMENGQKSLVKWTLMYEKLNPDIPDPHKYLDVASSFTKSIDAYLVK